MVCTSMPSSIVVTRLARTAPAVIGSVLLHAGFALAFVATAGGHARAGIALPVAMLDVDVAPVEAPLLEPMPQEAPQPNAVRERQAVPTHTHAYPVAPSHDARPHDPSLHHEEAASAAEAAPVEVAQPAQASALPHFSIPSGAGVPTSGHVSANGTGSGLGRALAASGGDDIVPASGVQVPAKLVSSVVAAYPSGARSDDVEGDVGVEIVVDREGHVVEARVVRPAGHGFDDAALAAIRRYRFAAAQREGHAVRVRMPWSVQFRLR